VGYDMHELSPHPEAEANKLAHNENLERLRKFYIGFTGSEHKGSYLTPAEEEGGSLGLSDEEREELRTSRRRDLVEKATEATGATTWGEIKGHVEAHMEQPPSAEYNAAQKAYEDELMNGKFENDPYFRLNNHGMRVYYEQMDDLDMIHHLPEGEGGWPNADIPNDIREELEELKYRFDYDYKWDRKAIEEKIRKDLPSLEIGSGNLLVDMEGWDPMYIDRYLDLQDATQEHLSQRVEGAPGVCSIKFSDNSGWIVTPEEAASAVEIWEALPQGRRDEVVAGMGDYWLQWIEYLRGSSIREGFCVN
jgi:hypothetical protein